LALGLSPAAATKWRSGAIPRDTTLLKIATYFNVTVDYLLSDPAQNIERNKIMFWKIFYSLCQDRGISPNALAKELSISSGAVTTWKNGRVPHNNTLLKIATYFNVTVDYLLGNSNTPTPDTEIKSNAVLLDPEKTRMIPVYESVSAGFGTLAQDLILEYMPMYIPSESEAHDTICIRVKGDSMSPDIEDGDIIQVYKTSDVDNGNVAVVLVDGEEALVKKVFFGMASVELHSINPAYPPITFKGAALARVQIMGVVRNTIKNSKKPHAPAEPLFTEDEAALIKLFRQIPEDQRKIYLEMGRVYANSLKKD
jgi:repressor LexA